MKFRSATFCKSIQALPVNNVELQTVVTLNLDWHAKGFITLILLFHSTSVVIRQQ